MKTMNRLTTSEMAELLNNFSKVFNDVAATLSPSDYAKIGPFINDVTLIVPCFSMRPDKMRSLNDSIFSDTIITQFIMDLSFRFYTLIGDYPDHLDRLVTNLVTGLQIDGPDIRANIIPQTIAQSCPANIFEAENKTTAWWSGYFKFKSVDAIRMTLLNNKHLIVLYLIYLTSE